MEFKNIDNLDTNISYGTGNESVNLETENADGNYTGITSTYETNDDYGDFNNFDNIRHRIKQKEDYTTIAQDAAKKQPSSKEMLKDGKTVVSNKKEVKIANSFNPDSMIRTIRKDHGFYEDIRLYDRMYRWGYFNLRSHLTNTIEYVFFTKPDLHLTVTGDDTSRSQGSHLKQKALIPALANISYFQFIEVNYPQLISELQYGYNKGNPFSNLLFNQLLSNIDVPSIEAESVETAVNRYGVGLSYRSTSEASNYNFDFSLEFKDTKWLDVYHYFKIYEEYETLKHHGVIAPETKYIEQKMLHDELSIYKFLVDEDASTIIYWCKYTGVYPKSLPRETFATSSFDNGLSYSINFRASFFEDMNPDTLAEFNELYKKFDINRSETVQNEIVDKSHDNYHTNINYKPLLAAQVKYVAGGQVLTPEGIKDADRDTVAYTKEDGTSIGRYVLEFY